MTTLLRGAAPIALGLVLFSCGAPNNLPATTPFGVVDVPAPGAHVPQTFLALGWALDDDALVQVSATVDGTGAVPIRLRSERQDVAKVFPTYASRAKRAGWKAVITVSTFGPHSLVFHYADADGHTHDFGPIPVIVDPPVAPALADEARSPTVDPSASLPFGMVDSPAPGALVAPDVVVKGWAVDDRGINEIRVFVDRKYVRSVALTDTRDDVASRFPRWKPPSAFRGWSGTIALGPVSAGPHSMIFQAVNATGMRRVLGVVPVVVRQ